MCGILGAFCKRGVDARVFNKALQSLAHRGPNFSGVERFNQGKLVLGHQRLKIIDLSSFSNQPMTSPKTGSCIIFNGEIVNYKELKQENNYFYQTGGDTEVLLKLWEDYGEKSLDKLVGMFAFAIYEPKSKCLYLVRDRFGIKPLYFSWTKNSFYFASECKALLNFSKYIKPDYGTIRTFLETGLSDFGNRTFFRHVKAVSPGTFIKYNFEKDSYKEVTWYNFPDKIEKVFQRNTKSLIEEGRFLLNRAVRQHLISDVPVGVNISGGVDSTVLAKIASLNIPKIKLFNQNYPPPYGEAVWCRKNIPGKKILISECTSKNIFEKISQTVMIQEEPFSGVPVVGYYFLYQNALKHGTPVLLDANGVDEAFLGYKKYHLMYLSKKKSEEKNKKDKNDFFSAWGETPPSSFSGDLTFSSIDGSVNVFQGILGSKIKNISPYPIPWEKINGVTDIVRRQAAADLILCKIPRNLRFNDRMSMAFSRELRVPFLDHRLVEFGFSLPTELLLNKMGSKALFREIAAGWIPRPVAFAKKRLVQTPQREWISTNWKNWVQRVLTSDSFCSRGWIDFKRANELFEDVIQGRNKNSFQIWQWINLELWARQFLD